jgi:hypothetical protein
MITRASFVRLEATTGREEEVESFLRAALSTVDTKDGTPLLFALPFGPSSLPSSTRSPTMRRGAA